MQNNQKSMKEIMDTLQKRIEKNTKRKYMSSASLADVDILATKVYMEKENGVPFVVVEFNEDNFTMTYHEQPIRKMGWFTEMYGDINVHIRIKRRPNTTQCMYVTA